MAKVKNISSGANNKKALINNKPRRKFRTFLCMSCSSPEIKPIVVYGSSGKNRGTFYICTKCGEINREKKIIEMR